jgi:hypothetical protein
LLAGANGFLAVDVGYSQSNIIAIAISIMSTW